MLRRRLLAALDAGAAATLAGCATGGDGETNSQDGETQGGDGTNTVAVGSTEYGDVLVDADGASLYVFDEDSPGESTCYDGCASSWPPLTVAEDPSAGPDVEADLATTEREDGSTQVTVDEWPLYYYSGDSEPGDTSGHGVGDVWWLVAPDGSNVQEEASGETTTDDGVY